MTSGYSGKPLAQKLGLKPGLRAAALFAPHFYEDWVQQPIQRLEELPKEGYAFLHAFYTSRVDLEGDAPALRDALLPGGALWISWPKKASGVPSDVTEQTLRDVLLPLGIVDVKVCAVNEIWSGLLFRHRRPE